MYACTYIYICINSTYIHECVCMYRRMHIYQVHSGIYWIFFGFVFKNFIFSVDFYMYIFFNAVPINFLLLSRFVYFAALFSIFFVTQTFSEICNCLSTTFPINTCLSSKKKKWKTINLFNCTASLRNRWVEIVASIHTHTHTHRHSRRF